MRLSAMPLPAQAALASMLLACSVLASADLIPPPSRMLMERLRQDAGFYDQADQFCRGKALGDRCLVSGTPLDGGGVGVCRRRLDEYEQHALAECVVNDKPMVDRQVPSSPYQLSEMACQMARGSREYRERMAQYPAGCELAPTVADRFCQGRREGDACVASVRVGKAEIDSGGRCGIQVERFRFAEHEGMSRPVLTCRSANPVEREFKESSPPVLKRRFDWWPW